MPEPMDEVPPWASWLIVGLIDRAYCASVDYRGIYRCQLPEMIRHGVEVNRWQIGNPDWVAWLNTAAQSEEWLAALDRLLDRCVGAHTLNCQPNRWGCRPLDRFWPSPTVREGVRRLFRIEITAFVVKPLDRRQRRAIFRRALADPDRLEPRDWLGRLLKRWLKINQHFDHCLRTSEDPTELIDRWRL